MVNNLISIEADDQIAHGYPNFDRFLLNERNSKEISKKSPTFCHDKAFNKPFKEKVN